MSSWTSTPSKYATNLSRRWRAKPALTAATIGGVLILVLFLIWLVVKIVDSGSRINTVTDGVLSLAQPTSIDGGRMPHFTNGAEYGISMWLYLSEPPRTTEMSSLLTIGGSPVFQLNQGRADVLVKFPAFASGNADANRTSDAAFDHVSLKRWVHLMAVHVDGTVTLFKDGELYAVNRMGNIDVTAPSGTIRIGERPIDGFVSSVVFMNGYPSSNQVKRLYRSGPQSTNWLFRAMGFNSIGLRSPVYRTTE